MKTIEEYFKNKENVLEGSEYFDLSEPEQEHKFIMMKRIKCNDGFTMSVQAGYGKYCSPRVTAFYTNIFLYGSLEVGFPSKKEPLLMEYCEDSKRPTKTVYGYVPVEVIDQVLEKHGGIKI